MTRSKVRTAIFPVAGLGTRFMPATKGTPKELLPVIDTPLIQYAIDEAREAGIARMIFVSHPSKAAIQHYVMDDAQLRTTLVHHGKAELAHKLELAALDRRDCEVIFVMQLEPKGLGDAVACARPHLLDGPVAVILPDDLILGVPGCLRQMIDAYDCDIAGHLIAVMKVPWALTCEYGILSVTGQQGRLVFADSIVEKPTADVAPSQMAVVGRYILDPAIFDTLAKQGPGIGGEIQLTDAIAQSGLIKGIAGFRFSGRRFDCGSKQGMLTATLFLAQQDPAYAEVLATYDIP
ncbi:sugar phosphate nucleotidyltransferase [Yoonia sp.]|nr:sugar phosphate nucleotidyltransferase [Yoonia sp.]